MALEPGESACLCFRVPTDMLSFTGPDGTRRVEPGSFELMIGSSSAAIHLRAEVEVSGPERRIQGPWRMTSRARKYVA